MPTKRYSTEQIVSKLRQAEVELSRGLRTPAMCKKLGEGNVVRLQQRRTQAPLRRRALQTSDEVCPN